jgi:hypothetical protein
MSLFDTKILKIELDKKELTKCIRTYLLDKKNVEKEKLSNRE